MVIEAVLYSTGGDLCGVRMVSNPYTLCPRCALILSE